MAGAVALRKSWTRGWRTAEAMERAKKAIDGRTHRQNRATEAILAARHLPEASCTSQSAASPMNLRPASVQFTASPDIGSAFCTSGAENPRCGVGTTPAGFLRVTFSHSKSDRPHV